MLAQIINLLKDEDADLLRWQREFTAVFTDTETRNVIMSHPRPTATVLWNATVYAARCRCGSIRCPACGMVKFVKRVNRVSERIHHAKAIQ